MRSLLLNFSQTKFSLLFLLLSFLSTNFLDAKESDVIRIELQKETPLTPIYIENTHSSETKLSQKYCEKLESLLRFNFSYNARSEAISQKQVGDKTYLPNRPLSYWKENRVPYVFKLTLRGVYLTVAVWETENEKVCFAEEVKLCEDLERDRLKIHQLSSHIHEALFHEEGIYLCQILYTSKTKNAVSLSGPWVSEVYQCDWDGGREKQLTHEDNYCVTPSYLPAKTKKQKEHFFYVSYKLGQPKIYWSTFSSPESKRFTFLRGNQLMPSVSPCGNQLAFINDAAGNPDLFIQDFNPELGALGKPRQLLTRSYGVQASPTYSPDGKQLAFVSNKDGAVRIYTLKIPEGEFGKKEKPVLITKKSQENTKPSWSPDGKKLAYIARVDGVRQVWIYDFETKKEWQLTHGPGSKENPVWAFNSLHLAFNSVGNASCELYLVNLNQPQAIRILPSNGQKRFPVWVKR